MLFLISLQLLVCSLQSLKLPTVHCQLKTVSTVVFSFFNYFFQYVKERFVSLQSLVRSVQLKLPTVNCHLLTGMVENNGFEPLTPCVQGRCSSQLS